MHPGNAVDLNQVIPALRRGGTSYFEFYEPTGPMRRTLTALAADVRVAEAALARLALPARARVGILGVTGYQWLITDLACLARGVTTVPMDPEVHWDCARIFERYELDLLLTNRANDLTDGVRTVRFEDLREGVPKADPPPAGHWGENEPFTVIFTSGTSGEPKAIEVRKRCFDDQFDNALRMFDIDASDTMLVFLPFHIYLERCFIYLSILRGFNVLYASPRFVVKALRTAAFTFTVGVPHFFSSLQDLFLMQISSTRHLRLQYAMRLLLFRLGLGFLLRRPFAPFLQMLGGKARFLITGSAPCPLPTLSFYHAMGVPLYEGYGMSEIAGMIALNAPGRYRLGTVGHVFPNKEIAFDADGQILVRGPNVANARYSVATEEEAASTFLDDGWIATGDVGHLDRDGYLRLEGRIKDLIVLSNGHKVQPAPIEAQINAIPGVDYSIVLGSERPHLVALVSAKDDTLDPERLDERLRRLNEARPVGEAIKRFRLLNERFTIENGLLTRSLKLNRRGINERYAPVIEELYCS